MRLSASTSRGDSELVVNEPYNIPRSMSISMYLPVLEASGVPYRNLLADYFNRRLFDFGEV